MFTHSFYGIIQWFNVPFEQLWQCCMWFSKHYSENDLLVYGRIADCNKNISSHLRSLNASEQTQISESTLILSRSRICISPVTTFKICQVHRDRFGIFWKFSSVECKHTINEDSNKSWSGHFILHAIANILGVENHSSTFKSIKIHILI